MSLSDPHTYYAILAVIIFGLSKGGFGSGGGVVAAPLMALAFGPRFAIGVFLPILLAMDVIGVYNYWGKWDRKLLIPLLVSGFCGVALGALFLNAINDQIFQLVMATLAGLFFLYLVFKPRLKGHFPFTQYAWPWGMMGGGASFLIHAGGPPIDIYLLSQKIDRTTFQAITVGFFAMVNLMKLPPYLMLGVINAETMKYTLYLLPFAPVAMWAGIVAHKHISDRLFFRIIMAMLLLATIKLFYDAGVRI